MTTQLKFGTAYLLLLTVLLFAGAAPKGLCQSSDQALYTDSLQNSWQDYGWATRSYSNPSPVHAGSDSISVTAEPWTALYLHHAAEDSSPYISLTFWINGGAGGQKLNIYATVGGSPLTAVPLGPLAANTWQQVTISLNDLGVANNTGLDGFWISDSTGTTQPTFYVDDIALNAGTIVAPPNSPVTVNIDAAASRHAISPLIYGVAYGTADVLSDLNCPINRYGGNNASRYNWQLNADNRANDWYYESIGDASSVPGERGDTFISTSKAAGADAMLTIPMIPWIAKLGPSRSKLPSFSVAKYGAQQSTDSLYMPDAGNGVKADGSLITGNDPNDANVPNSPDYEADWISHLVSQWGLSSAGGLKYYILDNEPSIWQSTHRDVHPVGATMDEVTSDIIAYAAKVKAADPSALTVAPEEWGWSGYFYSGYDQQYGSAHNNWSSLPDRAAHGNMDYIPYMLQKIQQHDALTGQRLLDILSVHFYPQGGEYGDDVSPAKELLRNRSTRQLWDPNYVSESWINDKVDLIPRLKSWVAQYYPGTKTAITEYNWGAEASINGATTQADIFGIFGREGLDLATRWTYPNPSTPTYKAMKMYRNYDGSKDGFGDTSVSDAAPNPDNLSSFAALRSSDGALTVMVISKVLAGDTPVTLNLANFNAASAAQAWQLTSVNAITQIPNVAVSSGKLTATVPAQSITLFVIPPAAALNQSPTIATAAAASPGAVAGKTTDLTVLGADDKGESGLTYSWATIGTPPAAVTFSANGSNAAKAAAATFTKAGSYSIQATVTDGDGAAATSTVNVIVNATPTTLSVAPGAASVQAGATQQFTAAVRDQFGAAITPQPSLSWSASGGGTIHGGLFTAAVVGGPFTATAACGAAVGGAAITVTPPAPPQDQSLTPTADAFIQSGSNANSNFGSAPLLAIRHSANDSLSSSNQCAYLKFDLSQVTKAPASAKLSLTVGSAPSRSYRSEVVTLYSIPSANWTESGITWNNAPGLNPATFTATGAAVAFQAVSHRQRVVAFDLTSFVAAHLGQVVTLQLDDTRPDGGYVAFASREAARGRPMLTISY